MVLDGVMCEAAASVEAGFAEGAGVGAWSEVSSVPHPAMKPSTKKDVTRRSTFLKDNVFCMMTIPSLIR